MNLTQIVVGGLAGTAMVAALIAVLPLHLALFCVLLLAYEGWTLMNGVPHDTLSEAIWRFARRPMFVLLCGIGIAEVLKTPFFTHSYAIFFLGFLSGHFFFTPHGSTDYLEEDK